MNFDPQLGPHFAYIQRYSPPVAVRIPSHTDYSECENDGQHRFFRRFWFVFWLRTSILWCETSKTGGDTLLCWYLLKGGLNPSRPHWHRRRHRLAIKSYSFFQWFFQHHLISILTPFCLPTWSQNRSKIHEKSIPRAIWKTSNFFHLFFIEF